MPLLNAQCPNCGALLNIDGNTDLWFCGHCGSKFKVQDAINQYNITNHIHADVVNIISNNAPNEELNRLLSKINSCMKLNQPLHIVMPLCDKLVNEYPDESIAWWKYVQVFLFWNTRHTKTSDISAFSDGRYTLERYNNALALCQDNIIKRQMEQEWLDFWHEVARSTISGKWLFRFDPLEYKRLDKSCVPIEIQQILHMGIVNANVLEQNNIGITPVSGYGKSSSNFARLGELRKKPLCNITTYDNPSGFEVVFALGKSVCTFGGTDLGLRVELFESNVLIHNAQNEIQSYLKDAQSQDQTLINKGVCPLCNGQLRRSFFQLVCNNCGQKYK